MAKDLYSSLVDSIKKEVQTSLIDNFLNPENKESFIWDESKFPIPFNSISIYTVNEYDDERYVDYLYIELNDGTPRNRTVLREYIFDDKVEDFPQIYRKFKSFEVNERLALEHAEAFVEKLRAPFFHVSDVMQNIACKFMSIEITREEVIIKNSRYNDDMY
jgi:hypothetical protein